MSIVIVRINAPIGPHDAPQASENPLQHHSKEGDVVKSILPFTGRKQ